MDIDELTIKVMSSFGLQKAVCDQGFFTMAPNLWILETKTQEIHVCLSVLKAFVNGLYLLVVIISVSDLMSVSCVSHKPSKLQLVLS